MAGGGADSRRETQFDQNSGPVDDEPMDRFLPITEVKARLPELVSGVEEREERIVVTRNGKPSALLVSMAEYSQLKETLDVLSDPDLMRQIRASARFFAKGGRGLSIDEVFGATAAPRRRRSRA